MFDLDDYDENQARDDARHEGFDSAMHGVDLAEARSACILLTGILIEREEDEDEQFYGCMQFASILGLMK